MVLLISVVLLLAALALVINSVIQQRLRQQRVMQRLEGGKTGTHTLGTWLRAVGSSKVGQRSVSLDHETQTLLTRLGWRTASQRSLFAAFRLALRWCWPGWCSWGITCSIRTRAMCGWGRCSGWPSVT